MPRNWTSYPTSGPRRAAKEGIATKRARGAIGDTWWSKRFVAVLEAITGASRLQRGRSYARSGQVSDLRVDAGVVAAKVQGSRVRPYEVTIAMTALTEREWAKVEDALAARALFAAALLAGEMPREIEEVFAGVGTPLFPTRSVELRTQCSCPDYANPCKHVAATYYILAERFDDDPFAILAWRGRDREALVGALHARRSSPGDAEAMVEPADPAATVDLGAGFYRASAEALDLRFRPDPGAIPEAVLRQLGPSTVDGRDLAGALGPAYRRIVEHAARRLGSG
jgi:uncharacterized Zn finger protein